MKKQKVKNSINFYLIGALLIIAEILLFAYNGSIANSFWYDEAYTIELIKYSFDDIIKITAGDVHPPLYYFMLKIFTQLFGDSIYCMRLFSGLGIIGCLIFGLFSIKRLFGPKIALAFMLLVAVIPITQYLSTEIRMYSWAMFFVLGCSVFAYKVYLRTVFVNYIWMTLFAICASYTHYYALISTGVIYLLLGFGLFRKGRITVRLILFSLIVILAYSPWITVLTTQIQSLSGTYWATTPTAKELLIFIYYFFSPKEPSHAYTIFSIVPMAVALSIMLILIGINIWKITKLPKTRRLSAAHGFALVYLLTMIITLSITYLIKPISVPRYTTCMLGPLLLAVSIYVGELWKNGNKKIISITFICLAILSFARIFSEKEYNEIQNKEQEKTESFLSTDISYIVASEASYPQLAELSVLLPEKNYLIVTDQINANYTPFDMDITDSFPTDLDSYHVVRSENDSIYKNSLYSIKEELILKNKTILLLEKMK